MTSSLADRITKPDAPASGASWADEVYPPTAPNDLAPAEAVSAAASIEPSSSTTVEEPKDPIIPQMDGATEPFFGSQLQEPDYTVDVKLADLQADPNNPLYSIKSFEELGLWVIPALYGDYTAKKSFLGVKISSKVSLE